MKHILSVLAALAIAFSANAVDAPRIKTISTPGAAIIQRISNNGKWAVGVNTNKEETEGVGGVLFNLTDGSWVDVIGSEGDTNQGDLRDVTDNGEIVVGNYNGIPAYWTKSTGRWTALPLPSRALGGIITAVTPDGKYAVGETIIGEYERGNGLWDLATGTLIPTPGLPTLDMQHENNDQLAFVDISADGRYILARMSFSYIEPPCLCSFVYDRQTSTYDVIGFTPSDTNPWLPKVTGLHFTDFPVMSPNGNYVTGIAYMVKGQGATAEEYETPFVYNVLTREFTVYDMATDQGFLGSAVTDDGTVYASAPASNPIREWYVRSGKYWYAISDIYSQHYGRNIYQYINAGNSGTPASISGDGRVIGVFTDPRGEGYLMYTYEDLKDACSEVDLLGNYSITPLNGSSFSAITEVKVAFDRNIAVYGAPISAYIVDGAGNKVRSSMGMNVNAATLAITFRPTEMRVGEQYKVVIPAGTVSILGDASVTNREITVTYKGRSTDAVKMVGAFPAEGAKIAKLDFYTSQIMLTFDTNVQFTGAETAWLYRGDDANPFAQLLMSSNANQVALYPISTEYLYDGVDYRVEMAAGSVTDLGGQGANEKITLHYQGSYVREVSTDDKYLFSDDFSGGPNNFMYFEGDFLVPTDEMKSYGFSQDGSAWYIARDSEESEDFFMMSHSCYVPAGQSNDWMVTPQIYIPDDICRLTFDSQSYRKNKQDRLKVYVIPSNTVYNYVSDEAMADFMANRVLIYDELQQPGDSGDTAGEWTHNDLSLAQFAGKAVYIAFVNDNYDQSIVFVDNVTVIHDMRFLVTIDAPASVIAQDEVEITGRLTIDAEGASYSRLELTLNDANGVVSTISQTGMQLTNGSEYRFAFPDKLPLAIGKETAYAINVKLDDESMSIDRTIKNMAFQVEKHVVLEEYSGSQCGNCPGGIVAVENLERTFGERIIPIAIRTFGGDKLSSGLDDYAAFLGLTRVGAPSAVFNRTGEISTHYLSNENGTLAYSSTNPETPTWLDVTVAQLAQPAEAEITASIVVDEQSGCISVPCTVRYALDATNLNLGLFLVITEDNVEAAYQENYFSKYTDALLGDWGAGGIYGSSRPRGVILNDVARSIQGNTYNGTLGLLPSSMNGGQEYTATINSQLPVNMDDINNLKASVLLIDCNTDRVINAFRTRLIPSGIDNVLAPSVQLSLAISNGAITAYTDDDTEVTLSLYSVAGICLGNASGTGSATIETGYKGLAIARAATAAGIKIFKITL